MKMIIRADDVGFTKVHNMGTFETLDNGLTTSCDVMLDTPGTVDALERLRDYPWISIGWHPHFWGAPVLDPSKVPSMYDAKIGHFRRDLSRAEDVSYEECLAEMHAQMERCIKILGKAPDVCQSMGNNPSPFGRAMNTIIKEYGIVTNFLYAQDMMRISTESKPGVVLPKEYWDYTIHPDEKWADKKIYMMLQKSDSATREVQKTDSIKVQRAYDPVKIWTDDECGLANLPEDATAFFFMHPGYIDYYVCREGSQTPYAWNYLATRAIEVQALCSEELKNWVRENKVEMVNFRDALYGTNEYQNHLRAIGSDLCMK